MPDLAWKQISLGEVAHIVMGQAPPGDAVIIEEIGIPFLQGNAEFGVKHPDPNSWCKRPVRRAEIGDVLISVRAPVGAINVADQSYGIGRGLAAIRFKEIDPAYGWYALGGVVRQLARVAQGSTFDAVGGAELANLKLCVPVSLYVQRRIVEILDAVDARANSAAAERSKAERFKEGMAQSLIPVCPDPGVLGSDWKLVRLSEVVPSADYGISTSLELGVSGTPTLRMNNLVDGGIRLHEVKVSTEAVPPKLILRHGDVLFNRTNSFEHVGRTSMWRSELPVATFASYLVRLNPDLRQLVPEYLVRWLNRPAIQQRIRRVATPGVHQVNINPTSLRKTLIELPADPIRQQGIVSALAEAEARVLKLRVEHQRLLALKQGLVNDLLSGRVRV